MLYIYHLADLKLRPNVFQFFHEVLLLLDELVRIDLVGVDAVGGGGIRHRLVHEVDGALEKVLRWSYYASSLICIEREPWSSGYG